MIIYYAMTKFHLIFSITHRLSEYDKDEETIIFLYSGLQDLETNYSRLVEREIFKNIYIVPEIELRQNWKPLNDNSTNVEIERNVKSLVENVEEWLPYKLSYQDTIYLANDHWALGTYCIYNKIPYIYYEDGVGMLSKPQYSYELVRKLNVTHAIVASYIGAFGQNENVVKKLADLNNQSIGFYDTKAEHYDLKEKLKMLSMSDKKDLLYIFDAPQYSIEKEATILLTEHFVNMKRLSIEGQRELYALLVDFFGKGDLYIKPHPNDFHISYNEIFPTAKLISRKFPSELLPYCFDGKLELGLAACSTSVYGLKDILNNTLRFDIDIENHYRKLISYWCLKNILVFCNKYGYEKYQGNGIYKDLLNGFGVECEEENYSRKKSKSILIADTKDYKKEHRKQTDVLVFLDEDLLFDELKNINKDNLIPVRIQIKPYIGSFTKGSEMIIWVCTNDVKLTNALKRLEVKYEMEYTKAQLDVEALTDNKEIQIKILRGNLNAALRKIDSYVENEKELKQTIRELEQRLKKRDIEILNKIQSVMKEV